MNLSLKIPIVSPLFLFEQKEVLKTLGIAGFEGLTKKMHLKVSKEDLINREYPEYSEILEPRSNPLIDEYVKFVKGNLNAYKNIVPFHFFPQWAFPLIGKSLRDLPISFIQIMNAGFKVEIHNHIPRNEKLFVRSQLVKIEEKKNFLYFTVKIITETKSFKDALIAYLTTLIRLPKEKKEVVVESKKTMDDFNIPFGSKEIASFNFSNTTGLNYAILSGDLNPVHWIEPYAKLMGLKTIILHGFASASFCIEAIHQNLFTGDVSKLKEVEVKFTKPLFLPAKPKLYYLKETNQFFLGDSKLARAYLVGNFKI
ncbi:MAG: MaoC/PaaZ C-terminal domain-containing protein [Leptonema sp. (in: bacteria)]